MGVKKSTVCTRQRSSETRGDGGRRRASRATARTQASCAEERRGRLQVARPSFAAQPLLAANCVRRILSVMRQAYRTAARPNWGRPAAPVSGRRDARRRAWLPVPGEVGRADDDAVCASRQRAREAQRVARARGLQRGPSERAWRAGAPDDDTHGRLRREVGDPVADRRGAATPDLAAATVTRGPTASMFTVQERAASTLPALSTERYCTCASLAGDQERIPDGPRCGASEARLRAQHAGLEVVGLEREHHRRGVPRRAGSGHALRARSCQATAWVARSARSSATDSCSASCSCWAGVRRSPR